MQHCPSNCHSHTIQNWPGVAGGAFSAPDHEYPVVPRVEAHRDRRRWCERHGDLETGSTDCRSQLRDRSRRPSARRQRNQLHDSVRANSHRRIQRIRSAQSHPSPLAATNYTFTSWSDGGAQTHNVTASASGASYTATYTLSGGTPVTYVSDLTFTRRPTAGGRWSGIARTVRHGAGDGTTITLNGTTLHQGPGHARRLRRALLPPSNCTRFKAIGRHRRRGRHRRLGHLRGVRRCDQGLRLGRDDGSDRHQAVDVSIAGAAQLRLGRHQRWRQHQLRPRRLGRRRVECGSGGGGDTTPPTITARTPAPGATGVAVNVSPTATFSEAMNAATLTTSTFTLVQQGQSTPLAATRLLREPGGDARSDRRPARRARPTRRPSRAEPRVRRTSPATRSPPT